MTQRSDALEFDRVLVVGGAGFIGCHLVESLSLRSQEITVVSRSPQPATRARALQLDITQRGVVRQLLRDVRPTTVFNLAGRRPSTPEDTKQVIELNLLASIELLEESARIGVERIILVGSAEEYGGQSMPVSEDAPLTPRSIYGASKAAMTLHALAIHQTTKAPVVVVRPFSVYGPGSPLTMFVAEAADCAARGQPFRMTDGEQKRDLIYVADVVEGLLAAASAPAAVGQVFNLGAGVSHAMKEVAAALWAISGTSSELLVGARTRVPGDLMETRADIAKARNILGWEPRTDLETGLRSTWLAARQARAGGA